jgi:hypothetical protein
VGMSLLGIQTTWGDRIKGWFLKKWNIFWNFSFKREVDIYK